MESYGVCKVTIVFCCRKTHDVGNATENVFAFLGCETLMRRKIGIASGTQRTWTYCACALSYHVFFLLLYPQNESVILNGNWNVLS